MAISKRELQLSQDLMDLQTQYNAQVSEIKVLRALCFTMKNTLAESSVRVEQLLESVSILKSLAKNDTKVAAKKYADKKK